MDVYIDDLSEFVKIITGNKDEHFYHDIAHLQVIYRGHANKEWKLLPAAFRNNEDFLNEGIYLRECLREIPEELASMDYFDILVKAQHYGVPTRLLDFSLNPFVALYFACNDAIEEDGCVFAVKAGGFSPNEYSVQLIMHYLFKYKHDNSWDVRYTEMLSKALDRHETKYFISSPNSVNEILQKPSNVIYVFPNLNNARIRIQQGVFALYNTHLQYDNNNGLKSGHFCFPHEENFSNSIHSQRIIIPKEKKAQMLNELGQFGIHKAYLFPEFEMHAKYIVEKIKKANKNINERITEMRLE